MAGGASASLPNSLKLIAIFRLTGGGPAPFVFYRSKAGIWQSGHTRDSDVAIEVMRGLAYKNVGRLEIA